MEQLRPEKYYAVGMAAGLFATTALTAATALLWRSPLSAVCAIALGTCLGMAGAGLTWRERTRRAGAAARPRRAGRGRRRLAWTAAVLAALSGCYLFLVYTSLPWVAKWRTLYIETALTTMHHQYLATRLLPKGVVEQVRLQMQADLSKQSDVHSSWSGGETALSGDRSFGDLYWELSPDTVASLQSEFSDPSRIYVDNLDGRRDDLTTSMGEQVALLDVSNNLLVVNVEGDGYVGKLAVVKDPRQVDMAVAASIGSYGAVIGKLAESSGAILAMNASGFKDDNGVGNGGTPLGLVVQGGQRYGTPLPQYLLIGMKDSLLNMEPYSEEASRTYDWAVQWHPALVVNGEAAVTGSFGMGFQPRSAVGQTEAGEFLMLVIDGRQPGYSLGATVADCTEILLRHRAYQAANLDGGSSAEMWYGGSLITQTSSPSKVTGRYLPNALIVTPAA